MSKNPEEYILNCLNTSVSKFAHSFSKADRFGKPNRITEAKYNLPSTISRRTCSFGFGNKASLIMEKSSPPPGTYESLSEFSIDKVKLNNTPMFGYGRDKVLFGSYLNEAKKKGEKLPSPNKYNIKPPSSCIGGHIGVRLKTEPNARTDQHLPTPCTYNLQTTDMANSSSFFLSTFKKSTSPKYHRSRTIEIDEKRKKNKSVFFYDVEEKQFGMSKSSKFKNVTAPSFGKSKRESLIEKWRLKVPGFKYTLFSEFGNSNR